MISDEHRAAEGARAASAASCKRLALHAPAAGHVRAAVPAAGRSSNAAAGAKSAWRRPGRTRMAAFGLPALLRAVRLVVQHRADPVAGRPAGAHLPLEHGGCDGWSARLALVRPAGQRATTPASPAPITAFTCGLLIWGWHEISFLMGFVTGPRREPCPPGSTGWLRLRHASRPCLYHELAIAGVGAAVVVAVTWGAANQFGTWTFVVLWAMRQSAKLNVFLGVPQPNDEFLPDTCATSASFFRKRR